MTVPMGYNGDATQRGPGSAAFSYWNQFDSRSLGPLCSSRDPRVDGYLCLEVKGMPYKDPAQRQAYLRQYRKQHRKEILARQHQYYVAHREERLACDRRYRDTHREECRERERQYAEDHRAQRRHYRETHRQEASDYPSNRPEGRRVKNARRRAQKLTVGGAYGAADIVTILLNQKGRCWWCKRRLDKAGYEIDHRVALARGGSNDPSNLVAACPSCNRKKHTKTPQEFAGRLL